MQTVRTFYFVVCALLYLVFFFGTYSALPRTSALRFSRWLRQIEPVLWKEDPVSASTINPMDLSLSFVLHNQIAISGKRVLRDRRIIKPTKQSSDSYNESLHRVLALLSQSDSFNVKQKCEQINNMPVTWISDLVILNKTTTLFHQPCIEIHTLEKKNLWFVLELGSIKLSGKQ